MNLKFLKAGIFLFLIFSNKIYSVSPASIVPAPQSWKLTEGSFAFRPAMKILVKGQAQSFNQQAALEIAAAVKNSTGFSLKIEQAKSNEETLDIDLFQDEKLWKDSAISKLKTKDESYYLDISKDRIRIHAPTQKGIMHGAMSLIQLIDGSADKTLPCFEMFDYPDLKVRGISDDISRGQVSTPENFRRIIRFMARYKMNVYEPYIEDVFQFKKYPTIGVGRGALNAEDIKAIVSEARKYYIDVIPIFETLGHFENILSQPEFARFGEFPGSASLDVSNDSIYILLENMLSEIFQAFPSSKINIAADESFDVGQGNSKKLVAEKGIARVHADHYMKVFNICKKYNKTVLMYGDIILEHPEILTMIPKDIQIVDWDYGDKFNYNHVKKFKDAGFRFYVSPAVWNFTTSFPALNIALPNIKYFTKAGIEEGAEGMINSQWGDYGAETFRELNLFPFAYGAQCAWNFSESDISDFSKNYFRDFYGSDDERYNYVYQTFSNMYGDLLWHDVWQYPGMKFKRGSWMYYGMSAAARKEFVDWTMKDMAKIIDELQKKSKRNQNHFDLMRWLVKLNQWYGGKAEIQASLLSKMDSVQVDSIVLMRAIDENMKELETLKNDYRSLWIKTNKKDNLYLVEEKFNRMLAYWTEIKGQLASGRMKPPLIESKWIYAKLSDAELAPKAMFSYEFELASQPSSALLQVIADTYNKLYVNGKYVEEVSANLHLSIKVEHGRVKMMDILPYLKVGKNVIGIQAESFKKTPQAGTNVIGIIKTAENTLEINSSEKWKASADEGKKWSDAITKAYPQQIVSPDFATKRPSWIER